MNDDDVEEAERTVAMEEEREGTEGRDGTREKSVAIDAPAEEESKGSPEDTSMPLMREPRCGIIA